MLQELVGTDTNCTQMCIEPNLGISAKKTFAKGITIQSSCFYCLFTPWLGFLKSPEVNLIWAFLDDMTKILIQNIFLEKKCCKIQIQNIFLEKKMLQNSNSKYIPGKIDVAKFKFKIYSWKNRCWKPFMTQLDFNLTPEHPQTSTAWMTTETVFKNL